MGSPFSLGFPQTKHPYFDRWQAYKKTLSDDPRFRSVPLFRSMIQQYKINKHRSVPSSVSEVQFALACSIHPVKLAERWKRVRAVLKAIWTRDWISLGFTVVITQEKIFPFTSISAVGLLNCVRLFRFPSSRIGIRSPNSNLSAPLGSDGDIGISLLKRTSMNVWTAYFHSTGTRAK
jgi:hypothetical protein